MPPHEYRRNESDVWSRRRFLKAGAVALAAPAAAVALPDGLAVVPGEKPLKIGLIADLHHGFQPDAMIRLEAFLKAAEERRPDFIVQMGDFCHPTPGARECVTLWDQFSGPRYHVLGNHDMDLSTKAQTLEFWGVKKPWYSLDAGEFHFVVLDCNFILKDGRHLDYAKGNYYIDKVLRDRISPEQVEWLKADLAATNRQTFVLSHQAFDEIWDGGAVPNRLEVRSVIKEANDDFIRKRGVPKVIACISGHHHVDLLTEIEGVHYLQMNSASYYWAGGNLGSDGPRAVYEKPLFAFLTIRPSGEIALEGRDGNFKKPTPAETGHPQANRLSASILSRTLKFKTQG